MFAPRATYNYHYLMIPDDIIIEHFQRINFRQFPVRSSLHTPSAFRALSKSHFHALPKSNFFNATLVSRQQDVHEGEERFPGAFELGIESYLLCMLKPFTS